jgi:hypothetical protein
MISEGSALVLPAGRLLRTVAAVPCPAFFGVVVGVVCIPRFTDRKLPWWSLGCPKVAI